MTFPINNIDIETLAGIAAADEKIRNAQFESKMDLLAIYAHSSARAEKEANAEEQTEK
jgi:hypothetical protein